jgi:CubicO group peptidase (beta-lactamase class C family)
MKIQASVLASLAAFTFLAQSSRAPDISRMEQIVQSYTTGRQFMGSVLVARGDEILFSKSYGAANLEWNVPNTPTTKFRIGSITKQFTAAAILLLEERGKFHGLSNGSHEWISLLS